MRDVIYPSCADPWRSRPPENLELPVRQSANAPLKPGGRSAKAQEGSVTVNLGGRPRKLELIRQRQEFIGHLTRGVSPEEAAELSGHSAARALKTLSELGFKLTSLEAMDKAA